MSMDTVVTVLTVLVGAAGYFVLMLITRRGERAAADKCNGSYSFKAICTMTSLLPTRTETQEGSFLGQIAVIVAVIMQSFSSRPAGAPNRRRFMIVRHHGSQSRLSQHL